MSGCRIWIGAVTGMAKNEPRPILGITTSKWQSSKWSASRVAYFVAHGVFDDAPMCVESRHLFLGTQLDNNRDRHLKGRTKIPKERGEQRYNAKLAETDIPKIFSMCYAGKRTREMADLFGVARQSIANVLFGKAWKHHGFPRPNAIPRSNQKIYGEERRRVVELRRAGWTYAKLSQEFGVSVGAIQGIIKREQ